MTPNDKLPETIQEQIKADAISAYPIPVKFSDQVACMERREGYTAGATAWAGWKVRFDELKDRFDKQLTIEQELLKAAEVSLRASQTMADALEKIEKWCEESGLKNVAIDDVKGMAIYHSLHLAKQALQQFKDGKVAKQEPKPEGWPWVCEYCGKQDCGSDHK